MTQLHPASTPRPDGRPVLVGTRGSGLALRQTEEVLERLRILNPQREFHVVTIRTQGDVSSDAPLTGLGRGIFVKEIERALFKGEVDVAVHSLKDMPTALPEGLAIGAVCQRANPRDALVNRWGCRLEELPEGARIGTSSPRRTSQLRSLRPDVQVLPIRGNVDTRLRKARGDDYDGAILATAGLERLGLQHEIAQHLSTNDFVPAPGQGVLAVEVRGDDVATRTLLSGLEHHETRRSVTAERAFLEALGGGCQVPVGAYARCDQDTMVLTLFLGSVDGAQAFRTKVRGRANNPHETALDGYQRLVERGAGPLLKEARQ